MLYQIIFDDETIPHPKIIEVSDDVFKTKTINDIYEKAYKLAKKDNLSVMSHDIPDEYWLKAGASKVIKPDCIVTFTSSLTMEEPYNAFVTTCRTCDHFESGICHRYGGHCDPNTYEYNCHLYCGNTPRYIYYNKQLIQAFFYDPSNDLEVLNANKHEIITDLLKQQDYKNIIEWLNDNLPENKKLNPIQDNSSDAYKTIEDNITIN